MAQGEVSKCRRAMVLYLYENAITRIEGLAALANLTHVYLQRNAITRIEGLSRLRNLSKLYVSQGRELQIAPLPHPCRHTDSSGTIG